MVTVSDFDLLVKIVLLALLAVSMPNIFSS